MKQEVLQKEIAQFEALKKASQEIANICNLLTITDSVTLAIATQNLSKAKMQIDAIDKLRKEVKDPHWQKCVQIDKLAAGLSTPIEQAFNAGKVKIKAFNDAKLAKAIKEQNRIKAIKDAIQAYSNTFIEKINKCTTESGLLEMNAQYIKKFPDEETWFEFMAEAQEMRKNLHDYVKARKIQILTPNESDDETVEEIKNQIIEKMEAVGVQEIANASYSTTTSFRGTWKAELIDINAVPKDWLIVDDKKVKEYLKQQKDAGQLKDGDLKNGFRFYIDKSVSIR